MDKAAIKTFAINSRRKLMEDVEYRMSLVGIAKDGAEAIDIITANKDNDKIKAILLDLNMPKVDGFAVLEFMRQSGMLETIPVSIISGDSSKETIDRAFTYGIVDMLGKPFNADDVKRVVEKNIYYKEMNK